MCANMYTHLYYFSQATTHRFLKKEKRQPTLCGNTPLAAGFKRCNAIFLSVLLKETY